MTTTKKKISASILSADFGRLADQIQAAEAAGVDWIHVDVMDGHFVPNLTIGLPVLAAVRQITKLPLDVHLMISNPHLYIKAYIDAGADWLGVQVEAAWHLDRLVQQIKELGARATVVLNPATPLASIEVILGEVDMVLLMTVNPGYSGQKFIPATLPKIRKLREMIDAQGLDVLIQVDGGVHLHTIDELVAAGVDVFVSGSGVFDGGDITGNVRRLGERLFFFFGGGGPGTRGPCPPPTPPSQPAEGLQSRAKARLYSLKLIRCKGLGEGA